MALCSVCHQELQEGYSFCHVCGAPVGGFGSAGPPKTGFVEWVDTVQGMSSRSTSFVKRVQTRFQTWLGEPISIQRQIWYTLLTGLAVACVIPWPISILTRLQYWLVVAAVLFLPIRYSLTGIPPLTAGFNAFVGTETSLRRRLLLSFWPAVLGFLFFTFSSLALTLNQLSDAGSEPKPGEFAIRVQYGAAINLLLVPFLISLGASLVLFYMMGFSSSWRPINYSEFSIRRERMAKKANSVASQIRDSMKGRSIPGLQSTEISMASLRLVTSGASSGTEGKQISFSRGSGKIVLFVQDFGEGLFIRWTAFYDASGRRLWLLIGYLLTFIDGILLQWTGGSFTDFVQRMRVILLPSRDHQVISTTRGGFILNTLRLAEGVSEYSWNEIYALQGAVTNSVVEVLQAASSSHEEAEKIRSEIERHSSYERSSAGSGRGKGR